MELTHPVEEQPDGIGTGHLKPFGMDRPDLREVTSDDLEDSQGRVGHEQVEGRGGDSQAQVGGVVKKLVHPG